MVPLTDLTPEQLYRAVWVQVAVILENRRQYEATRDWERAVRSETPAEEKPGLALAKYEARVREDNEEVWYKTERFLNSDGKPTEDEIRVVASAYHAARERRRLSDAFRSALSDIAHFDAVEVS